MKTIFTNTFSFKVLLFSGLIVLSISCGQREADFETVEKYYPVVNGEFLFYLDGCVYYADTMMTNNNAFLALTSDAENGIYVMSCRKGIVLAEKPSCDLPVINVEFVDYNADGFSDLIVEYGGNTPGIMSLYLYDDKTEHFHRVKGFSDFPAPEKVLDSDLYYSYHHSGCADRNWDSDLFFITEDSCVTIGNISGRECVNLGVPDGVYINKVNDTSVVLLQILPVSVLYQSEGKFGFIKHFWENQYSIFAADVLKK